MLSSVNASLFKSTVAFRTVATNLAFLNINEGLFKWHHLFHLFLADWGFPSSEIKKFQSGRGITPIIFFSFSAEHDLPPYGWWLWGAVPGQLTKRGSHAVPTLSCSLHWEFSFPCIPSQWSLICFLFLSPPVPSALLCFCFCSPCAPRPFLPPRVECSSLFQLLSRGFPNPSFSISVHTQKKTGGHRFAEHLCAGFAASCRRWLSYDNTLCSQMLHECVWLHLIGLGLVQYKCACSLGAVNRQCTTDSLFGIQGQTLHMNKSLVQHIARTMRFS